MTTTDTREDVIELATAQRGMMWLFIAKLGLDFSFGIVQDLSSLPVLVVYWGTYLALSCAVAYFVFRVARVIHGTGPAFICGALVFAPCLGALCVLMLNGTTTDRLRKAGTKLGFFGVTAKQLQELKTADSTPLPT